MHMRRMMRRRSCALDCPYWAIVFSAHLQLQLSYDDIGWTITEACHIVNHFLPRYKLKLRGRIIDMPDHIHYALHYNAGQILEAVLTVASSLPTGCHTTSTCPKRHFLMLQ